MFIFEFQLIYGVICEMSVQLVYLVYVVTVVAEAKVALGEDVDFERVDAF